MTIEEGMDLLENQKTDLTESDRANLADLLFNYQRLVEQLRAMVNTAD